LAIRDGKKHELPSLGTDATLDMTVDLAKDGAKPTAVTYLDTETMGFYGLPFLIQTANGNGETVLFHVG